MYVVPPMTGSSPMRAARSSTLSTPFCSVRTDDPGPRSGATSGSAVGVVVGLHRDDHDIDGPDLRRVLFRPRAHGEAPERRAPDLQPALADRRQVRPARDERHVVPRPRELGAVIAADGA